MTALLMAALFLGQQTPIDLRPESMSIEECVAQDLCVRIPRGDALYELRIIILEIQKLQAESARAAERAALEASAPYAVRIHLAQEAGALAVQTAAEAAGVDLNDVTFIPEALVFMLNEPEEQP